MPSEERGVDRGLLRVEDEVEDLGADIYGRHSEIHASVKGTKILKDDKEELERAQRGARSSSDRDGNFNKASVPAERLCVTSSTS